MYRALYRKWRPRSFDEMSGQQSITSVLKRQTEENKVSHAYLFCGTRGTGKTSTAKILAKAVNCENPQNGNPCNDCYSCRSIDNATATDVLEIDAASNNRVADVRELIDEVVYPPSILKKRVYIIDEVHMLSDSAFNALLKTLEEPPEYVLFILATTELNQLPSTIISRCMRFDFKRIEPDDIFNRISYIAQKENINIEENALSLISRLADGSLRDALSLLDACSSGRDLNKPISLDDIQTQLGITNNDILIKLFEAVSKKDIPSALSVIEEVHKSSKDLSVFMTDIVTFVKDLLIAKSLPSISEQYIKERFFFSALASDKVAGIIKSFTTETLLYFCSVLEDAQNSVNRFAINKRTSFELTVIKLCDTSLSESPKALLARISELEKRVANGISIANTSVKSEEPASSQAAEGSSAETKPDTTLPIEKKIDKSETQKSISFFAEFLEELKNEYSILPFVKNAKVIENGNQAVIYTDQVGKSILSSDINKKLIEDALMRASGKSYFLSIEIKNTKNSETTSPLDELN